MSREDTIERSYRIHVPKGEDDIDPHAVTPLSVQRQARRDAVLSLSQELGISPTDQAQKPE